MHSTPRILALATAALLTACHGCGTTSHDVTDVAAGRFAVTGAMVTITEQTGQFQSAAYVAPGQYMLTMAPIAGVASGGQIIATATSEARGLTLQIDAKSFDDGRATLKIFSFDGQSVATDGSFDLICDLVIP